MNRFAAFVFWGLFGTVYLFFGVVWLAGQERNSSGAATCTTKDVAIAFAEKKYQKVGVEATGRAAVQRTDYIEVMLYSGMSGSKLAVYPDCTIKSV